MVNLKDKALKGFIWSAIERFSGQGIQFLLGLILARILLPNDYGLIGMVSIFLAVSQTFIDSGFTTALIQKKNRDYKDFSTIFYFNIFVAATLYLLLFFAAPYIASFFNEDKLILITRIVGLTLIISSFGIVQYAKLTIDIDFKTQTKASVLSSVSSGLVAILMALKGYGVWALVLQALLKRLFEVVLLWIFKPWVPSACFSFDRFKLLYKFGSRLLISGVIDTIYKNIFTILIGKYFNAKTLGFYTKSKEISDYSSMNFTSIIQRVTFPVLSEIQSDDIKLREAYKKIVKLSALVIFPLMIGIAALAEPFITLTLTDKWIDSVWMLQLLCVGVMWYPIHAINLNILNVKGRSDLFLKVEVLKKALITIVLILTVPLGIKAMLIGQIITSILALPINTYYSNKIIGYGFIDQIKDLFPVILLTCVMGLIAYLIGKIIHNPILGLLFGSFVGAVVYIISAWVLNVAEIKSFRGFIKR